MIVTTDVTGIVKVWDTRTQRCLQTVKDPEQHVSGGVKASIVDDEGRLITGGQSIHRWKTLGAKQERETRVQRKIRAKQIKGKRNPSGSFVAERSGSGMNGQHLRTQRHQLQNFQNHKNPPPKPTEATPGPTEP